MSMAGNIRAPVSVVGTTPTGGYVIGQRPGGITTTSAVGSNGQMLQIVGVNSATSRPTLVPVSGPPGTPKGNTLAPRVVTLPHNVRLSPHVRPGGIVTPVSVCGKLAFICSNFIEFC